MNIKKIKIWVELGSSLAAIVGIVFIAWQIQVIRKQTELQSRALEAVSKQIELQTKSLEVQAWQFIMQQMNDISKIFIDHPELYPFFFQGVEVKNDDKKYPMVASTADLILDFIDEFEDDYVRELPGMNSDGESWVAWNNYFVDQFSLSPSLCKRYNDVESWYSENGLLHKVAEKGCSKFDKNDQNPLTMR